MEEFQTFDSRLLDGAGLNRQAVFNIADLPADMAAGLGAKGDGAGNFSQLILIAHAGRRLWEAVQAAGTASADPIDHFSIQTVHRWFAQCQPHNAYEIVYPGPGAIGLQRLGQLAGWHHPSPFMIGIDREWGTWFAYRAVVLADTAFEPTRRLGGDSPCDSCSHRTCVARCPGAALGSGPFDLGKCIAYRRQAGSGCANTCLARVSCPVGSTHRYGADQLRHTYSRSLQAIAAFTARPALP